MKWGRRGGEGKEQGVPLVCQSGATGNGIVNQDEQGLTCLEPLFVSHSFRDAFRDAFRDSLKDSLTEGARGT